MRIKKALSFILSICLILCCSCRKSPVQGGDCGSAAFDSGFSDSNLNEWNSCVISSVSQQSAVSSEQSSTPSSGATSSVTTPAKSSSTQSTVSSQPLQTVTAGTAEKRAVWISFLEYMEILKGKTETQFTKSVREMFDNCVSFGLNTVIVQARSHADAFYKSKLFPASLHFTGSRKNSFPFDPLDIMVTEAHRRGLKIEAWVNPYRGNKIIEAFAPDDPIQKWLGTDKVFKNGEYYYFNPGEPEVKQLVIDGVNEIVQNYNIDGIHFDDYFYPSADSSLDAATFKKYGSGKTLLEFRTYCVNDMVSSVYKEIKKRKNIVFGISPAGNIETCINIYCSDVKLWAKSSGYVDYIAPQLYWDYGEGSLPYDLALENWKKIIKNPNIKLVAGLAAYKAADIQFAPYWTSGNTLSRQVEDARKAANYGGFALFRYSFLFKDALSKERNSLRKILQ